MMQKDWNYFYQKAAERKGGTTELDKIVAEKFNESARLHEMSNDRILSLMSKQIFRAGFVWKVVDQKWPDFEEVFQQFDVVHCARLDEDDMLDLKHEKRIIRNLAKIKTVQENAQFILNVEKEENKTFAEFLEQWPTNNLIALWDLLKKRGSRLGGLTGQYLIRFLGKDSFILSKDVTATLLESGIITGNPTSKKSLLIIQAHFNQWQQDSGKSFTQLSRILAFSIDVKSKE